MDPQVTGGQVASLRCATLQIYLSHIMCLSQRCAFGVYCSCGWMLMRSSSLVCLTLVKCGGRGFDSQLGQVFFRGVFRRSCVSCNPPQVLGFFLPQSSLLRLIKASGNCLWSVFVYLCRLHFCAAQHTRIYLFISVHSWGEVVHSFLDIYETASMKPLPPDLLVPRNVSF